MNNKDVLIIFVNKYNKLDFKPRNQFLPKQSTPIAVVGLTGKVFVKITKTYSQEEIFEYLENKLLQQWSGDDDFPDFTEFSIIDLETYKRLQEK
ncbi:MAG: hypothetical protein GY793_04990 [Proteobacteria bacterium]|nr:hypothetical protein [Pseudomonadota bacterium]